MKSTLLSLILLLNISSFAQIPETNPDFLRTKHWTFGDSILLNFDDSIIVSTSNVHTSEAYSSFSSKTGKLLYYSDAANLYDSNFNIISTLKGDKSSVQGVLISGNDSIINVITTTDIGGTNGANVYTFKDGVKIGDKKILSPVCEMQSIVKHANQKDNWLVLHKFKSEKGYIFLIRDNQDPICPKNFESQNYIGNKGSNAAGSLTFSASSKMLALTIYSLNEFNADGIVELYKFNNSTGEIDYILSSQKLWLPIHSVFSPDETKLYSSERGRHLIQYDLSNLNIDSVHNSKTILWTAQNTFSNMALQNYSNGFIYGAIPDSSYLSVIKYPNLQGNNSGLDLRHYKIPNRIVSYGLPNFNASYFYTPSIDFAYTEDCWGHSYSFEGRDTLQATSWKWCFQKVGVSNFKDSSLTKHCNYSFPDTGKWQVSHFATIGSRTDTVTKTLTIHPKWDLNMLGTDTFYCTGDSINLVLQAPANMHCVHWGDKGPIEEPNLDNALGPIIDYDHFQGVNADTLIADTAGVYRIKVTNKTFCQAWDTLTIAEYPNPNKSLISRFKDSVVSNTLAHTYRWYRDGVAKFETTERRLDPDSNGYWQVQLVSEYGCESELSDSLLVDFASIPKINSLPFKIYPNPSDGNISIELGNEQLNVNIKILDMNGKLAYTQKSKNSSLITIHTTLTAGNYILSLTDEDGNTGSQKIEVLR